MPRASRSSGGNYAWKADAAMHERALAVQGGNRERFSGHSASLSVLGYERDASGMASFCWESGTKGGGIEFKGALFPIDPGVKTTNPPISGAP